MASQIGGTLFQKTHVLVGLFWKCVVSQMSCERASFIRTGWRKPIGCLKLQVIFRKRATNYRALLRKMIYKDKVSYDSTPPCTWHGSFLCDRIDSHVWRNAFKCVTWYILQHTATHCNTLQHTATHCNMCDMIHSAIAIVPMCRSLLPNHSTHTNHISFPKEPCTHMSLFLKTPVHKQASFPKEP